MEYFGQVNEKIKIRDEQIKKYEEKSLAYDENEKKGKQINLIYYKFRFRILLKSLKVLSRKKKKLSRLT